MPNSPLDNVYIPIPKNKGGRPKGSINKRNRLSRKVTTEVLKKNRLPLPDMIDNMIHYKDVAVGLHKRAAELLEANVKKFKPKEFMAALDLLAQADDARMKSQKCAADAAPYLHPRLSSITMDLNQNVHIRDLPRSVAPDLARDEFRRLRAVPMSAPLATNEDGEPIEGEIMEPAE